ncbi:hypothetical protein XH97_30000 [Bradyrhizobium sp. CCBAU 53380]|nr:hypothetical protein [Bradyrhizobium sp. CCBAU 53380]
MAIRPLPFCAHQDRLPRRQLVKAIKCGSEGRAPGVVGIAPKKSFGPAVIETKGRGVRPLAIAAKIGKMVISNAD